MRIWAFPSFYPYDYPGMRWAGTFAHRQYKGLINSGAELKVIVPVTWNPPFPFSELHKEWKKNRELNYPYKRDYDGVTVYHPRIANMKPNRFVKKSYLERYVDAIVGFFEKENIKLDPENDVFYAQWLISAAFVRVAAHRLGVKCAVLGIGDDVIKWAPHTEANMRDFKTLMDTADLVLTNADYLGRELCRLAERKIPYKVNYFGIDYDKFKPVTEQEKQRLRAEYKIPADKIVILIVGSPIVRKGWLDLLDALVEIKKTNANFMLVGGYAGQKNLNISKEVADRGLESFFYDQGEIAPDLLSVFYNMSDIFCLPSHWEGLATVVSEAMSSGLPVITTNVCGHPEIIKSGENGILIDPKDVKTLTAELLSLLNDPQRRTQLGEAARKFIVNVWGNDDENSKKLLDILTRLVKGA